MHKMRKHAQKEEKKETKKLLYMHKLRKHAQKEEERETERETEKEKQIQK